MLYEDRMAVATPEGVTLEFALAGLGSRFVAALLDGLVRTGVIIGIMALSLALHGVLGDWVVAAALILVFVVLFGYDIAFETWASGRTPGKRWTGIRVVKVSGAPVTFLTASVRNLLRLVDMLPTAYLIGMVCVLATEKNQRVGDMAAGTIVVRERTGSSVPEESGWLGWSSESVGGSQFSADELAAWDVSAVTADEVAAVREFLTRRAGLAAEARARLAEQLASRLRPKVVGPGVETGLGDEAFLEGVVAAKSLRT